MSSAVCLIKPEEKRKTFADADDEKSSVYIIHRQLANVNRVGENNFKIFNLFAVRSAPFSSAWAIRLIKTGDSAKIYKIFIEAARNILYYKECEKIS